MNGMICRLAVDADRGSTVSERAGAGDSEAGGGDHELGAVAAVPGTGNAP